MSASIRPSAGSTRSEIWSSSLLRVGQWLTAATLLAVPLVFSAQTQDQFELPKLLLLRALSSMLVGTLLVVALADKDFRPRRTPLDWPITAWSLWLVVCTLISVSPAVSWRGEYENFAGSLTQLNYSALFFLTTQFMSRPDKARLATRALLAAATGAALYALMQALQRDYMGWSASSVVADRFFGTLGNPNFLGGFMAMAITLKLGLSLDVFSLVQPQDKEALGRWLVAGLWVFAYLISGRPDLLDPFTAHPGASASSAVVLVFWLLCLPLGPVLRRFGRAKTAQILALGADLLLFFQALANTATRGAFLGLMAGLAVLALGRLSLRADARRSRGRLALRTAVGLGLLFLALAGAVAGLGPAFRQRTLESLKSPAHALEISRLEIWGPALEIWRHNPVAGTGVDTFKTVFPSYSHSRFADYDGQNVSSRMAHCEPLQILATEGIVGLGLWLWLCWAACAAWWRRLRGFGDFETHALLLGLGALLAAYLAQNLVSFGVVGISVPFWICLGLLFCDDVTPTSPPRIPVLGWVPALVLGSLVAVGGLYLDSRTWKADLDYAFANEAQSELPSLDSASVPELRNAANYALDGLAAWGGPLSPDLDAEVSLWTRRLTEADDAAHDPAAAQSLRGTYESAAGALLMVLSATRLEEAVRLCPHEVKYQVYLGLCYEELFKRCDPARRGLWFQAADAAYKRSTELNAGNAYYRGNRGRLWGLGAQGGALDFYQQSQKYYLQAVALAPVTRLFYENLLLMQARFARVADAGALLDKAQTADKELAPLVLMEAASTFFQWRDSDLPAWDAKTKAAALDAEADWAGRAVALAPGNADFALALAVFDAQDGRRAEAARWAHKALGLNPRLNAAATFLAEKHLK